MRFLVLFLVVATLLATPAEAAFLRGRTPIKNRYIVMLRNTPAEQVDAVATALARQHGGHVLATMQHAMRGFGVSMPEARAIALSHHPLVAQVEEDETLQLASEQAREVFDFRRATPRVSPGPQHHRIAANSHAACPWTGSYYLCEYGTSDQHWNLDRLDNSGPLGSYKAYAYRSSGAVNASTGLPQPVRAYVVDSGVYASHTEFDGRVEAGANMMLDPEIVDPTDPQSEEPPVRNLDGSPANNPCGGWRDDFTVGHGTSVASVLAGRTTGVAKHATVVPVKVINCDGERSKLALARGLDWIQADMAARVDTDPSTVDVRAVVNISTPIVLDELGTNEYANEDQLCESEPGFPMTNCVSAIEHEVNQLISANIPVVVVAGNGNNATCRVSPGRMGYGNEAAFPSTNRTITVGGTMYTVQNGTYVDQRWTCAATPEGCQPGWAEFNPGSNYGPCVSIWAPAWNVRVAHSASSTSYRPAGGPSSGTSFAAPFVAGVVARLLEAYPTLTPLQVWQTLAQRADGRYAMPDLDPSAVVNRRLVYMGATE